jgi:protein TonB
MLVPAPRLTAYDSRPTLRTRLAAVLLSLGLVALILATLIAMGMLDALPGGPGERMAAVTMSSRNQEQRKQQQQKASASAAPQVNRIVLPVPPHLPKPPIISKAPPVQMIEMSKADMAAADISKMGNRSGPSSGSGNSAGSYGPGEGPGGAKLYSAEWHREPSRAEIGGYLPGAVPPGSWGMIACKTIENYRVENCMQLGESPPGSGLARALRLASWQFLVRPPRIDGKPVIGAWVRIRFDFTRSPPSEAGGGD